jgi:hypothetical protein
MKRLLPLALLFLIGCEQEDRSTLKQRSISAPASHGWARLPLDAAAQSQRSSLWIGDESAQAIPYTVERQGLWEPQRLELERPLYGRNAQGQGSAEFSLKFPDNWRVREREQLEAQLNIQGEAPWVAEVRVERRFQDGDYTRLETSAPLHVFDLGNGQTSDRITLPWDAQRYRFTLIPRQGNGNLRITQTTITAKTEPGALQADQVLVPSQLTKEKDTSTHNDGTVTAATVAVAAAVEEAHGYLNPANGDTWLLKLNSQERVIALDLELSAPAAPMAPSLSVPPSAPKNMLKRTPEDTYVSIQGLVWNLPALSSKSTRIGIDPTETDRLRIRLPKGANLESAKVLVRRETLIFPAEAGKRYALHFGGGVKEAPGSLGQLPSSRLIYSQAPLQLGPAAEDPQGLPRIITSSERSRPILPWAVGIVVLLLGFFTLRLLKPMSEAEK